MLTSYLTVNPQGKSELTVQKSRFITYVKRTETEEEARTFIAEIKKEHWDASHNCSAYMIGENDLIQKADDDGEPSGTAGVPMLEVLKKRKLKDTCVVVTRYFGGIKLGGGGLIRAYSSAASAGIKETGVVERRLASIGTAVFDYTLLGKIENEIRSSSYILKDISYGEKAAVTCWINAGEENDFEQWLMNLSGGRVKITWNGSGYLETSVPSAENQRE
ncbi:MAG: YigZ family protein [Alkalicoccus sp.]|nr:MAG: YigZ family protein [Alkalicoccus sp.]